MDTLYGKLNKQIEKVYPPLEEKSITANGTYKAADDNVYGYSEVNVDVHEATLIDKTITENGEYKASDDNVDGFSEVTVDVQPTLIEKMITENGLYEASSDNVDGYSSVDVEVPDPILIEKTITQNGVFEASSDGADGYSSVDVDVDIPTPTLITKNIIQNGTYNASSDNADGYRQVNVEVPSLGVLETGAIIRKSKNLFNKAFADTTTDNSQVLYTDYIYLEAGTYCYSVSGGFFGTSTSFQWYLRGEFYDLNKVHSTAIHADLNKSLTYLSGDWYETFTVSVNCYFKPKMYIGTPGTPFKKNNELVVDFIQVEKNSTPTVYEEYYDELKYPKTELKANNLVNASKNLFNKDNIRTGVVTNQYIITNSGSAQGVTSYAIPIENGEDYTLSSTDLNHTTQIVIVDSSCMLNSNKSYYDVAAGSIYTFTASFDGYVFISVGYLTPLDAIMFEKASSKSSYEPFYTPRKEFDKNEFIGKSLYVFGDSIMAASTVGVTGVGELLAEKYGMVTTNYGHDGDTIRMAGTYEFTTVQYKVEQASNLVPDYIIWNGGTNDISDWDTISHGTISTGFSDTLDRNTFCGAFESTIKTLLAKYPGARIIYCTTHVNGGRPLADQNECWELTRQMCKKWGMVIADINFDSGLNSFLTQYKGVYTDAGGTHPNTLGYKLFYLPVIEHQL